MGLGYEGYAKIQTAVGENTEVDLVPCTGATLPDDNVRLDSSGGYGGKIKSPTSEIGIGSPHVYDYPNYNGNINFEVSAGFITNQIIPALLNRQNPCNISFSSRHGNITDGSQCFWNNINITGQSGAIISGTLGFVGLVRSYTQGQSFFDLAHPDNKVGQNFFIDHTGFNIADPIVPNILIPFWKTKIIINGSLVELTQWSVDFSQEIVKFFACENHSTPQVPSYVAAGPLSVVFSGEYALVNQSVPFTVPDWLDTLDIHIDSVSIDLKRCELNSTKDDLVAPDTFAPINFEYFCYEISV